MACILLKDSKGNIRRIPENTPFIKQPDEKVSGVDHNCATDKAEAPASPNTFNVLARELNTELGSGAGDWIKAFARPIAKLVGKSSCSNCEARRIATNAYGKLKAKHGQLEALRLIKEVWAQSTSNPEGALIKLKEYLKD